MIDKYDLASEVFGTKRAEKFATSSASTVITGTAVQDSEDGTVSVIPDGVVTAPDGEDGAITLPTSPNVKAGDNVIIVSTGGLSTTPIVTGASGSGDRLLRGLNGVQTLIRETADGVIVAKVGQSVGALVNADGSFDVVTLTWNGNEPTIGYTLSNFGTTAQIGRTGETHLEIDNNSMELFDLNGVSYFFAGDMRDASGKVTFTENHPIFNLGAPGYALTVNYPASGTATVYVPAGGGTYTEYTAQTVAGYPENVLVINGLSGSQYIGLSANVIYQTESEELKAYTFGTRDDDYGVGALSVVEGRYNRAYGDYSHAEGAGTSAGGQAAHAEGHGASASGKYSHAGGDGTIANGTAQTAIGKFNVADTTSLLIIGNGTADLNRSNALKLDGSGNLTIAGILTESFAITEQPHNVNASSGDVTVFTVATNDPCASYQWQWTANGGWCRCPHSGNGTQTLTVTCGTIELGASYRCVATFSDGTTATSDAASVTGTAELRIVKQPESVLVASTSDNFSFTVWVNDSSATYRWQTSQDGGSTWSNSSLSGNSTRTLGPIAATSARQTYQYRCRIHLSNMGAGEYIYSDVVSVTTIS